MTIILSLGFLLAAPAARAEQYDPQFSLSLDLLGPVAFVPGGTSSGIGADIFADWRPFPLLSLGTGLDFNQYFANGSWQASSWSLGGRLFPFGTQKEGEWYLQGTAGLDFSSTVGTLMRKWPGNGHGSVGAGYRVFMGEGNALDLGLQYDIYSPISTPLSSVGIKLGWTFLFGKTPGQEQAVNPQPAPTPAVKKARKKKPAHSSPGPNGTITATPNPALTPASH